MTHRLPHDLDDDLPREHSTGREVLLLVTLWLASWGVIGLVLWGLVHARRL
jgi:hypothetical protein